MVLYFKSRSRSVDSIVKTPESPAVYLVELAHNGEF